MKTKVNLGIALFFGILFSIFILTGTGCTDHSKDIEPVKVEQSEAEENNEQREFGEPEEEKERGLTIG